MSFTNDNYYVRGKNPNGALDKTVIKRGASIGAGSTIGCGILIGENAMIGIGSVETKDVPTGEL